MFTVISLILGFVFYFLPSFIANKKPHANGVFLVNLLLGWTVLFWVICLIWAFSGSIQGKCSACGALVPISKGQKLLICPNCQEQTKL